MATPPAMKSQGMRFAEQQLQRHGWTEGKGLGRRENGISEAIKVKVKCDTAGVGHNSAEQFTFHWWDHVFNKTASSISVEPDQDGVQVKKVTEDDSEVTNKKPRKALSNRDMLYGRFIKSATLMGSGEMPVEKESSSESSDNSEDEDEKLDLSSATKLTDEDLVKICGGRTAHKGARHGLTMSAKLSRIEEQERAFLEKYGKKKPKEEALKSNGELTSMGQDSETGKKKKSQRQDMIEDNLSYNMRPKKKKKKKKTDDGEEVEDPRNSNDEISALTGRNMVTPKRAADNEELDLHNDFDINVLSDKKDVSTSKKRKVVEELVEEELSDLEDLKSSKKKKKKKVRDEGVRQRSQTLENQLLKKKKKKRKAVDHGDEGRDNLLNGHQHQRVPSEEETDRSKKKKQINFEEKVEQDEYTEDLVQYAKKKKGKKQHKVEEIDDSGTYLEDCQTSTKKKKKNKNKYDCSLVEEIEQDVDSAEHRTKCKKKRKDKS